LATDLAVRAEVVADPMRLGSARLDVDSGPPLAAALGGPGDNRGANGLAAALKAEQDLIARGGLPARTTDLGSYAAEIVALAAMDAHRAEERARADMALSDVVSFRADSVSSVNLDEELASLMNLQQAYSVAARLITAVNEMLEELVDATR
jgi:flagellar hook-associated protein 1 FlgK